MLLAADIGGTSSRLLAVSRLDGTEVASATYPSGSFAALSEVVNCFRQEHSLEYFAGACFGLPGPVQGRQATLTNLPWQVSADQLETDCAIERSCLVNDFQAAAWGIETLEPSQLLVLHPGVPEERGHRLIAGAGTGLGVAPIMLNGNTRVPVACEGGHMSFAPVNDLQQDLLRWLWQQWEHVSWERILSGAGLEHLYDFLSGVARPAEAPTLSAAQITARAAQGEPVAKQTLSVFVSIYGSYLGSAALLWPAYGGIYIAGGIALRIRQWMQQPEFMCAMQTKGRMETLLRQMPVYLVLEEQLGLRGAALLAQQLVYEQAGG